MQKHLLTLLSASVFMAGVQVQPAAAATLPAMAVVDEEDDAYDQLTEKAGEQYEKEEYASAIALFERAFEIRPEPNILFNIGRIYEEWGKNEEAVKYYERFIADTSADYDARQAALKRLALLRELIKLNEEKNKPPEDKQPDNPNTNPQTDPNQTDPNQNNLNGTGTNPNQNPNQIGPQVPPEVDPDPNADRRKKLRPAGYALLGVGVAGGIVGAIMGGLARNIHGSLDETAPDINERRIIEARGRNFSTGADVMFGIGGVLAVTGIILIAIPQEKAGQTQRASVRPQVSPTGFGLTGRF